MTTILDPYSREAHEEARRRRRAAEAEAAATGTPQVPTVDPDADLDVVVNNAPPTSSQTGTPASGSVQFREQCLLLSYLLPLAKEKREKWDSLKKFPYSGGYEQNACLQVDGSPFTFVNRLTQNSNQSYFHNNVQPHELSSLQPAVRFFKISQNTETGDEYQQEINFPQNLDPSIDDLSNKFSRGYGVGLKDFTFAYEADSPWAKTRAITAKLTIFANSFSELLRYRPTADGSSTFRYIDLSLKTFGGNLDSTKSQTFDPNGELNFRLKAVVGWSYPQTGVISSQLRSAIYDSHMTLQLLPTVHTFDIDDQGRVTFVINYWAYVEQAFAGNYFNIFSDPEVGANMIKRKLTRQAACATGDCKPEALEEVKKNQRAQITDDVYKSMQILIKKMMAIESCSDEGIGSTSHQYTENKIRSMVIPYNKLLTFMTDGPYADLDDLRYELASGTEANYLNEILEAADRPVDPLPVQPGDAETTTSLTDWNISYFYVSDLIDIILAGIEHNLSDEGMMKAVDELQSADVPGVSAATLDGVKAEEKIRIKRFRERFKKYRILLGPVEIVDQKDPANSEIVNFGDIPISVKYFTQWLLSKTIQREESQYPLSVFLDKFFREFLRDFLNDDRCFSGTVKQRVHINTSAITSYRTSEDSPDEVVEAYNAVYGNLDPGGVTFGGEQQPGTDDVRLEMVVTGDVPRLDIDQYGKRPLLNISADRGFPGGDAGFDRQIDYKVYFAARVKPKELMYGDVNVDSGNGIFHYSIGSPTGIVKTIKLIKTESPGLAEVRYEQEGYHGLSQLRVVYDAEIKTFLNVQAFPGTYIFIQPASFAPESSPSELTSLGIGGYLMIKRTEHSLGPGRAESTIVANWVQEIEGGAAAAATPEAEFVEDPTGETGGTLVFGPAE